MTAYVFGAGASAHARYPLASNLLTELAAWLDSQDPEIQHIQLYRCRILQLGMVFPSLADFEGILERLASAGQERLGTAYECPQSVRDMFEDLARGATNAHSKGFYPQYLRDDLVSAVREFFYDIEVRQSESTAYANFVRECVTVDDTLITFNYDVALERALKAAGKWDIGSGYIFQFDEERVRSPLAIHKLHGSVNWFQTPMQTAIPPIVFSRDLKLLGYEGVSDKRIGGETCAVNNTGTLILPDTNKQFYWDALWRPLWESAAERLRGVKQLFIHGYSLPRADQHARELLFDNVSRDAIVHIFCRSASDRIAEEFRMRGFSKVLPNSTVGFESWVESHSSAEYRCQSSRA
jgi:hypothetical protein